MEEILVDIDKDGNVKMEGKGFVGTTCDEVMAVLEEEISIEKRVNKPEYRLTQTVGRKAGR